ncbi:MAG: DUF59 domain-containing protein [Euryarchaeota archaeon]|nr:DUF59 domain-containing protein [Euryarchaeota archaeon]
MTDELVDKIKDALSKVPDPHMGISIMDMGLVESVNIEKNDITVAKVVIRPTNPGCMSAAGMAMNARIAVEGLDEIDKAEVIVEGHMMSEAITDMVNK